MVSRSASGALVVFDTYAVWPRWWAASSTARPRRRAGVRTSLDMSGLLSGWLRGASVLGRGRLRAGPGWRPARVRGRSAAGGGWAAGQGRDGQRPATMRRTSPTTRPMTTATASRTSCSKRDHLLSRGLGWAGLVSAAAITSLRAGGLEGGSGRGHPEAVGAQPHDPVGGAQPRGPRAVGGQVRLDQLGTHGRAATPGAGAVGAHQRPPTW